MGVPSLCESLKMASDCPKFSIVTPSYNQAQFIEETIHSVLAQNYPNIEYIIIDGGSTDGSVEIIRGREEQLAYWVSEPDAGQYDAINKGFNKTTGEIMAWLNSDDKYMPWAISVAAEIFRTYPEVEWLTTIYPLICDVEGRVVECSYIGGFNRQSFFRKANLPGRGWYGRSWIMQESTFWRRSLWERAGGCMDSSLKFAGDFELWGRFFKHTDLYAVATPLASFRKHGNQKTASHFEEYLIEADNVFLRYGGRPYGRLQGMMRRCLQYGIGGHSLMRLPAVVGAVLTRMGVLYPAKVCVWMETRWRIFTDYVV